MRTFVYITSAVSTVVLALGVYFATEYYSRVAELKKIVAECEKTTPTGESCVIIAIPTSKD